MSLKHKNNIIMIMIRNKNTTMGCARILALILLVYHARRSVEAGYPRSNTRQLRIRKANTVKGYSSSTLNKDPTQPLEDGESSSTSNGGDGSADIFSRSSRLKGANSSPKKISSKKEKEAKKGSRLTISSDDADYEYQYSEENNEHEIKGSPNSYYKKKDKVKGKKNQASSNSASKKKIFNSSPTKGTAPTDSADAVDGGGGVKGDMTNSEDENANVEDGFIVITPGKDGNSVITYPDGSTIIPQPSSSSSSSGGKGTGDENSDSNLFVSPGAGDGNSVITFPDGSTLIPRPSMVSEGSGVNVDSDDDDDEDSSEKDLTDGSEHRDPPGDTTGISVIEEAVEKSPTESEESDSTTTKSTTITNTATTVQKELTASEAFAAAGISKGRRSTSNLFDHAKLASVLSSSLGANTAFEYLQPKIRQSTGFCQLNANGFYGEPIGSVYEVQYPYQVIFRDGTSQALVQNQLAGQLDAAIAEAALPYLFPCGLRRRDRDLRTTRGQRHLQTTAPTIQGLSRLPTDFPIVNGGAECVGAAAGTNCYVFAGFVSVFAENFFSQEQVDDVVLPAIQLAIQSGSVSNSNLLVQEVQFLGQGLETVLPITAAPVSPSPSRAPATPPSLTPGQPTPEPQTPNVPTPAPQEPGTPSPQPPATPAPQTQQPQIPTPGPQQPTNPATPQPQQPATQPPGTPSTQTNFPVTPAPQEPSTPVPVSTAGPVAPGTPASSSQRPATQPPISSPTVLPGTPTTAPEPGDLGTSTPTTLVGTLPPVNDTDVPSENVNDKSKAPVEPTQPPAVEQKSIKEKVPWWGWLLVGIGGFVVLMCCCYLVLGSGDDNPAVRQTASGKAEDGAETDDDYVPPGGGDDGYVPPGADAAYVPPPAPVFQQPKTQTDDYGLAGSAAQPPSIQQQGNDEYGYEDEEEDEEEEDEEGEYEEGEEEGEYYDDEGGEGEYEDEGEYEEGEEDEESYEESYYEEETITDPNLEDAGYANQQQQGWGGGY